MDGAEAARYGTNLMPTVGSPAAPQNLEGTGLWLSLSYLAKVRASGSFCSSIPRAQGCPEKAQQGPGLRPGSEPTSKGTCDSSALQRKAAGCQKTPGKPCGSRPLLGACQDTTAEVRAYSLGQALAMYSESLAFF